MKALIVMAVLLPGACSVFQPRDPEDPNPDPGFQWQVPTHPSIVASNLQNSITALSINHYMQCFHDDFVFLADPLDVSDPGFQVLDFSNWDRSAELGTVSSIFYQAMASGLPEDSLSYALFMQDVNNPDIPAPVDTTIIYRDYVIVAAQTEGSGWDRPAMGRATITMVDDGFGLWSILIWEDERVKDYSGENYTWGVAKAFYR